MHAPRHDRLRLLRGLALVFAALAAGGGQTNAPVKPPANAPASVAVEIPKAVLERKSVFHADSKTARDPFFPNSARRGASKLASVPAVAPETPKAKPVDLLELKGIAGPPSRRFALVNGQLLSVGEEAYVSTSAGSIKVKCVEISENSVVLTINDEQQKKELRLREGP
jgi:hypothetical protein